MSFFSISIHLVSASLVTEGLSDLRSQASVLNTVFTSLLGWKDTVEIKIKPKIIGILGVKNKVYSLLFPHLQNF